jgi:hypothetical protein
MAYVVRGKEGNGRKKRKKGKGAPFLVLYSQAASLLLV